MLATTLKHKSRNKQNPNEKRFSKYDRSEDRARRAILRSMPWSRRWMFVRLDELLWPSEHRTRR